MQGIQKVVFDIIKASHDSRLPFITKTAIIEEAKKTSLAQFTNKHHVGDKKSELVRKIDQALMHLKKKGLIRQRKRGHWTIDKSPDKYKPIICKALQEEYETHCPKCDHYEYKKAVGKEALGGKCKACGKGRVTVQFFRYYCPVRGSYIGDPVEQCELLYGSNLRAVTNEKGSGVVVTPMKSCYFDHVPKKLELEYAIEKVKMEGVKEERDTQIYLSKYHLPRPLNPEGK